VLSKLLVYSCGDGGLHVSFRFNRSKSHSFQIYENCRIRPIWCVSRRVGLKRNHLESMKSKYRVKGAAARRRTPPIRRSEDKLCPSVHWLAALGTLAVLPGQNRVRSEEFLGRCPDRWGKDADLCGPGLHDRWYGMRQLQ